MNRELVFNKDEVPESGSDDRYSGVRALWIKVIIRAVYDWVTYRDSTRLQQKKLAESASTWLFEQSELFNSFSNICHYVGLDPDGVRIRIRSMSKEDVAKIEYLERVAVESSNPQEMVLEMRPMLIVSSGEDDEGY